MSRRAGVTVLAVLLLGGGIASAVTVQKDKLQMTILAQVKPFKLPRTKPAPIAVFVAGHLRSLRGGIAPQVQRMRIRVSRAGLLQSRGLPVCQPAQLAATSSPRALDHCSGALIGSGQFWAHIVLPDQGAYPTRGRLLVFNGRRQGRPTLLAHIYTANPFNSSFTIVFAIRKIDQGPYGTELVADFPAALGSWGYLDRIKLTLRREYLFRGRKISYFNSACPAPAGTRIAPFPLAQATLSLKEGSISADIVKSCGVRQ